MNYNYRLLSKEQVFGETKIDVIRELGAECGVTDFAVLSGADASEERTAAWFLASASGYGDVCAVDPDGSRRVAYANSHGSVRPAVACGDLSELPCKTVKDISGFEEAEFGEYPQNAADRTLAATLEQEFAEGMLRTTGKLYQAQYEEFQYEGAKYTRVPYALEKTCVLSNGKSCKTGDAVWQAKQKCRNLVVVPPHFEEYIKYSKLARNVYQRYTDQVEPYGMDECWLDISGTDYTFGPPEKVANDIRETIKFELGLTISVGVSFNKIFAKLGSDMKKPDAVTVIPKDSFQEKIWGLPAADLLGVGRATQRVLDSYCIRTIGDLAKTDPDFLNRRLGKNGIALWQYANGNDRSRVMNADFVSPVKSVGHGITTIEDLENDEQV